MNARAGIALAVSIGLHAGAMVLFASRASPPVVPAGATATPAFEVVRVDVLPSPTRPAQEAPAADPALPRAASIPRAGPMRSPRERSTTAPSELAMAMRASDPEPAPAPSETPTNPADPSVVPSVAPPMHAVTPVMIANADPGEALNGTGIPAPAGGGESAAGGSLAATGPKSPPGLDLSALHERLSAAAKGCYPAAAKRFRVQGSVPVYFCVDGAGALARAERRGTSGSELLDRAAIDCVLPGAVPLPGPAHCYEVAVEFR